MLARFARWHPSRQRSGVGHAGRKRRSHKMKLLLHTILPAVAVCSAFAADATVSVFPVNSSLVEHLLRQPSVADDGKPLDLPYRFCGTVAVDQIKKYCDLAAVRHTDSTSKATLPNGAVCSVSILPIESPLDADQIRVKIEIAGPDSHQVEADIKTYPGHGLLLRCQTGDAPLRSSYCRLKTRKTDRIVHLVPA